MTTNAVQFRPITISTFHREFDEATAALEEEGIETTLPRTYGEVRLPWPYGWRPCVLDDKGNPSFFYDEDDGWQPCPNVTFVKTS